MVSHWRWRMRIVCKVIRPSLAYWRERIRLLRLSRERIGLWVAELVLMRYVHHRLLRSKWVRVLGGRSHGWMVATLALRRYMPES